MPEHRRFRDVKAGAQDVLDKRRRDGFAARGDNEVARTVDQA